MNTAAYRRFRTLGDLVDPSLVPGFLRAGYEVWSYGYGDGPDDPDGFTTITVDDLWLFEECGIETAAAEWGPFCIDFQER